MPAPVLSRRLTSHPAAPPLAALGAGLAGAAYLWHTNPHEGGSFLPRCPLNWATGLECPACGGTRMAYDLLHADIAAAFQDNAVLLVLGVPLGAWLGGRWLVEGLRGRRYRPRFTRWQGTVVLGGAVLWAVLRNLPF
ncbi:DUF2752 domain-containing protein [Streptomyces sp. MP131-18]|uniref:DUF2752 domain-containing protein n=1 Tax=Streptomyces sp. MP131-18 TaxID=1857892 RepID=UPI0009C5F0B6|nr:DUF2752 domain-containing protein [Streptomyces sp. MP131-18]ONK13651.1 hypothetical protein STBA_44210 [Streptomyces sp. MP131-18]